MAYEEEIFQEIKLQVLELLPSAKVLLFGSRANNDADEESDWDILILTKEKPDNAIKNLIHQNLFPLSVKLAAFINTVIVSEKDWHTNPAYYALHKSISAKKVMA